MDEWRDIEGWEGLYQVSNKGRVKSLPRKGSPKTNILKDDEVRGGYRSVALCNNTFRKTVSVHRLVATAFIPNSNNLPEVNHIDEDKTNNNDWNLEWCTKLHNRNHGTMTERQRESMINGKLSKKVIQKTVDGEIVKIWASTAEAARHGFNNVSRSCNSHLLVKGFKWEYYGE